MISETLTDGSKGVEFLYVCTMLYGDHKAKSVIDTQTVKRKEESISLWKITIHRGGQPEGQWGMGPQESQQTVSKMAVSKLGSLTKVILNINGLNSPIKSQIS